MKPRGEALRNIEHSSFDVCVIGGGATGSGCALDAQLRGLRTVLLDAGDFSSGTSSVSTKLVHGGVRYLEQTVRGLDPAELAVVNRALRERARMLRNAVFLTGTMEFLTPCYRWPDVAYYFAGMKLYDWLAGRAGLAPSHFISRAITLRRLPALNPAGLAGAVAYTDGQFDDARYNIALVVSFTEAGGEALNYARVVGFEKDAGGKLRAAQVDVYGGAGAPPRRILVPARAFVNATGPVADSVRSLASPGVPPRLRLSKGAHVVLPREAFPGGDALLIPKTEDGRMLFAIPWRGRLLVGTTDEEIDSAEDLHLTAADTGYLLRHLNRYFAEPVAPSRVVSGMAGARPLLSAGDARSTKSLARDHEVEQDRRSDLVSILGGKWTTYRAMAEDTINIVQGLLDKSGAPCVTRDHALAGSEGYTRDFWQTIQRQSGLPELSARHLAEKFGTRGMAIADLIRSDAELATPLVEGLAPTRAEVVYAAQCEMAVSIEDVLARRNGLEVYGWREALDAASAVAALLARVHGWPGEQREQELVRYREKVRGRMKIAGLAA